MSFVDIDKWRYLEKDNDLNEAYDKQTVYWSQRVPHHLGQKLIEHCRKRNMSEPWNASANIEPESNTLSSNPNTNNSDIQEEGHCYDHQLLASK